MRKTKKEDLRVIRTKKLIFTAFINLIQEKDYNSITVQDISDRAMINRSTFYSHFKDKQDVLDQVFSYALTPMFQNIESDILEEGCIIRKERLVKILTRIFKMVAKNRSFYVMALEGQNNFGMADCFRNFLTEHFSNIFSRMHVKDGEDVIPMDFIILYIVTTFMSSLKWWIDTNCSMSAEKMARLLMKIISSAGLQVCDVKVI